MPIPARVHFCWIGTRLPWAYVFSILSAAERSGMEGIVLHHTDALEDRAETRALDRVAGLELRRIDPMALLADVGGELGLGDGLTAIYRRLESPAMKADMLRAAILYRQGGIYLDMDTITVASLRPLLAARQFLGQEYIVWPGYVRASRSPLLWARSLILDLMRKAMRRRANGWLAFRHVERFYYRAVNNAVIGSEAASPFIADYLKAMIAVPVGELRQTYALGPDLLQQLLARRHHSDLTLHDPRVFYPLAPEISEHWFRHCAKADLNSVLSAETRVVHWYASVRTKSHVANITPKSVREQRGHQLYSALVCAFVSDLPDAA